LVTYAAFISLLATPKMTRRDREDKILERAINRGTERATQENLERGQQVQEERKQLQQNPDEILVKECSVVMSRLDQTVDPLQFATSQWNSKGRERYYFILVDL
jgi:hypothetical protein